MSDRAKNLERLQEILSRIVGAEWVSKRASYLTVRPGTSEEVSEIVKAANRTRTPVFPRGAGTGWWSPRQPKPGGLSIDMTRMNGVLVIDEDVMTVTAQAGISFIHLETKIGEKGYRLMIFPESGKLGTLGGNIETWGTSPYTSSVFEDQTTQVVGLKVVLPTGEMIQTGTASATTAAGQYARRFFPSDLTGLFVGAESAFGIITEATLRLYRHSELIKTRMVEFRDWRSVTAVVRKIQEIQRQRGLLTIVEQRMMGRDTLLRAIPRLGGIASDEGNVFLSIRGDGDRIDVERHVSQACEIARSEGGRILEDDVPEWWERRYGLFPENVLSGGPRIMIVAITPLGRFLEVLEYTERFCKDRELAVMMRGYPFGGPVILAHLVIRVEGETAKAREKTLRQARKLMEGLMDMGCVPHRVGTDFLPVVVKNLDPTFYEFVKKLKKTLDPRAIMKPGVVVEEAPRG
jgi:glycolate oxidase